MDVRWTQAARKHRIGQPRPCTSWVAFPVIGERPTGEPELNWRGMDLMGRELEVTAVLVAPGTVLVIHVMATALRRSKEP